MVAPVALSNWCTPNVIHGVAVSVELLTCLGGNHSDYIRLNTSGALNPFRCMAVALMDAELIERVAKALCGDGWDSVSEAMRITFRKDAVAVITEIIAIVNLKGAFPEAEFIERTNT